MFLAPAPERCDPMKTKNHCIICTTRPANCVCGTGTQISGSGSSYPKLLGLRLHSPGGNTVRNVALGLWLVGHPCSTLSLLLVLRWRSLHHSDAQHLRFRAPQCDVCSRVGHGSGAEVTILWKTGHGVTYFWQWQESLHLLCKCHCLITNIVEFRLHWFAEFEPLSDSQIWQKKTRRRIRIQKFWMGAKPENVTPAISGLFLTSGHENNKDHVV